MDSCEVCRALRRSDNVIKDYQFWRVALDPIDQYYAGRSYFTLHRHCGDLAELTTEEWQELRRIIAAFEKSARKNLGATLFNYSCLMNNAYQVKPYQPHIHWHVRPRFEREIEIEGEKFTDKEFGHHYAFPSKREPSTLVTQQIIGLLQRDMKELDA